MKKILILIIGLFAFSTNNAQTIEQIKNDHQQYLWGEGSGVTLSQADQVALQNLISQISTTVESEFNYLYEGKQTGKDVNDDTKVQIIVKTYSSATLNNTERIVISNEPEARVLRYIKRDDVHKVFEQRKNKVIQFATDAQKAESELRIADALRYYYWAYVLLRSHPDGNEITHNTAGNPLLITWLPAQINAVFGKLQISQVGKTTEDNILTYLTEVKYNNQAVVNFDYSYWDGRDWSYLISAKDGRGFVEFNAAEAAGLKELRIRTEYMFDSEARIDKELETVMQNSEPVAFRNAYFAISLDTKSESPTGENKSNTPPKQFKLTPVENDQAYREKIAKVVTSIRLQQYETVKALFTPQGYDMYEKLIHYGNAKIINDANITTCRLGEKIISRSVTMSFSFKNNTRKFVEDVVFYFNADGLIEALSFGLNQIALESIAGKTVWAEADRLQIINFLEHLKTAYSLKRIDYIESVFADDALIIVGCLVKPKPSTDNVYKDNQIIRYNRYTKEQYMKNLEHCFAGNEYINIAFEESEIRKSGSRPNVYGIQIKQNYFSSSYGDEGYLFLMIDLNNPDEPIIHVRTWQPEKNADGSVYGLEDF